MHALRTRVVSICAGQVSQGQFWCTTSTAQNQNQNLRLGASMPQLTKNRRLLVAATLLMVTATVAVPLWRAHPVAAAPALPPLSTTSSGGITIKFNAPASGIQLVATPFGAAPLATGTDSKLITVSNTGSATIKLQGVDSSCSIQNDLFQVSPGQEIAGVLPSASFSCGLFIVSPTFVAGSGVVTIQ